MTMNHESRLHGIARIANVWPPHIPLKAEHTGRIYRCVNWLDVQGFEVVQVSDGASTPHIYIKPSPLCDMLDGTVHMYERGPHGERRYKMAIRFGCEVRWHDEGGAA